MLNEQTKSRKSVIITQLIAAVLAIAAAVALPQATHTIGIWTGTGKQLSIMLSPMHLPVLFIGLAFGPIAGLTAGALSPLTGFALTGMPKITNLPLMVAELATYGLVSGMLSSTKLPTAVKLLISQIAGRIAYFITITIFIYALNVEGLALATAFDSLLKGLLGVAVQMAVLPPLVALVRKVNNEK